MGGNVWVYHTDDEIMANEKPFYAYIYIYILYVYTLHILYILYILYIERKIETDTYIERYMYFVYFILALYIDFMVSIYNCYMHSFSTYY